jgi:hypothetical protein
MSSVKAKLTVTLKADEVVVAESDNAHLWQRVLTAIHGGKTDAALGNGVGDAALDPLAPPPPLAPAATNGSDLDKLATEIGLDRGIVEGALSPSKDAPYLHLNAHCWQAMKKQLPRAGLTAMSPVAAASTLLALWFRVAGLGPTSQAHAQKILSDVGVTDKNPSRGVKRAPWLNARGRGQLIINPGEISDAIVLAKCFCSKSWSDWKDLKGKE